MAIREPNLNPSDRELRQFAGIWLPLALGVLGGLLLWKAGWLAAAVVLWGIGAIVAVVGLSAPRKVRVMYRAWMRAVYPFGWLVSHLVMAAAYFLVLTSIGVILRLVGYDPMCRRFDRAAQTYWVAHRPGRTVGQYFRQF